MKSNKRSTRKQESADAPATAQVVSTASKPPFWLYILAGFLLLFVLFEVYSPAVSGPFLFDDLYLPFQVPGFAQQGVLDWMKGVRPVLMFSFWANHRLFGPGPYSYHATNVFLHFLNGLLIWAILRRLLKQSESANEQAEWLSPLLALLFLFHPAQTESVGYVASRSEILSVLLFYAAFAIYLFRREETVGWLESLGVLVLFGLASLTKEHTAVLPALLILTDLFFNQRKGLGSVFQNWRLYLPIVAGGAAGVAYIFTRILASADSAGFGVKNMTWYQYFFTQCRAIWRYVALYLFPMGQSVDHDFPLSTSLFSEGAVVGLAALVGVSIAAILYRKRLPLAAYGWFVFLALLAPTSSFIPIQDLFVERRIYLPFLGLLLITAEFVSRIRLPKLQLVGALSAIVLVCCYLSWTRNQVWASPLALWSDAVEKAPNKARPRFQLAYAYWQSGACNDSVREYERVSKLQKQDYRMLVDWALAYDCAGQPEPALEKLNAAAALERTAHVLSIIGMVHAKQNHTEQALTALNDALTIDPRYDTAYFYRGNLHMTAHNYDQAMNDYRTAIEINPEFGAAREAYGKAQAALKAARQPAAAERSKGT